MSKSLGVYVENNLIKYAKVSKEHDNIKVEAYGVRTFENLTTEIKKIIEETYSFNTPISINVSNEQYLYFDIFALLSKKDIQRTTETEFDAYCEEKNYNKNAFEMRYALVQKLDDKDKIKAIDIIVNKIELNRQIQPFESYKLSKVLPLPMAIADIAELDKKENAIIVNMEESTTITTVIDQKIYDIKTLEFGSKEVLEKINKVENSYAKAYEICKNTTIYTAEIESTEDEQPYLQYIIPAIYNVREKVQEIIMESSTKFDKIYLTGTLASVNNIDLYFQEVLRSGECQILKPKFIAESSTQVNIKDYIEVNSAIALAMDDLAEGNQALNFKKTTLTEKLSQMVKIDTGKAPKEEKKKNGNKKPLFGGKLNLKFDLNVKGKLDYTEIWLMRTTIALVLVMVIFGTFSKILSNQMLEKGKQIEGLKVSQNSEIQKITTEKEALESKTTKYKALIKRLEEENDRISEIASRKNSIPNLLSQIMYIIPESVQVTSIDNTLNRKMVINAQASEYEELGYFIAKIRTKKILTNVISSEGSKNGETITVKIEGDLP